MSARRFTRSVAGLVLATMLIGVAACAAEEEPVATPSTEPTQSPAPTPETDGSDVPDPEPATSLKTGPIQLPGCADLDVASLEGGSADLVVEDVAPTDVGAHVFGPVARDTLDGALQARGCQITLPNSEFGVQILMAELEPDARDSFLTALDDSDYEHAQLRSGIDAYAYEVVHEQDGQEWFDYAIHAFAGVVWIAEVGGGMGRPLGDRRPSQLILGYVDETEAAN